MMIGKAFGIIAAAALVPAGMLAGAGVAAAALHSAIPGSDLSVRTEWVVTGLKVNVFDAADTDAHNCIYSSAAPGLVPYVAPPFDVPHFNADGYEFVIPGVPLQKDWTTTISCDNAKPGDPFYWQNNIHY